MWQQSGTMTFCSCHGVTPYSYNLYLLSRLLLKLGVFGKSGIVERWRSSFFLKHKVEQTVRFLMFLGRRASMSQYFDNLIWDTFL